jgi:2-haloacid dehalogenase
MIHTVVFDLGGVLIDWNPAYLYRQLLPTEAEVTWFLANICTPAWNEAQDAGRPLAEATEWLLQQHPGHAELIRAYYARWTEMLGGAVAGTVEILHQLRQTGRYRLYALTNWSAETFPLAQERFEFLHWFEGVVVSGAEKTRKPFAPIYDTLVSRYQIDPARAVYIDDNPPNLPPAQALGFSPVRFTGPAQLRTDLLALGLQFG